VKDVAAPAKGDRRLGAILLIDPEVVRQLPLGRQQRSVEVPLELRARGPAPGEPLVLSGLGVEIDAVVIVLAPEQRLLDRAEVELLLEARVDPGVEPRRFVPGLRDRREREQETERGEADVALGNTGVESLRFRAMPAGPGVPGSCRRSVET
jgi:hypothetical protein